VDQLKASRGTISVPNDPKPVNPARLPKIQNVRLETPLQGADEGAFEGVEHEMVANVLNLDERHVGAVLTPRSDVVFLEVRDPVDAHRDKLRQDPHSVVPLCDGGLDHVLGFVRSTRLLDQVMRGDALDLRALAEPALFVPETMTLMKLLEQFKRTHLPVALVVDEFGDTHG
jgi:putative hemolysin